MLYAEIAVRRAVDQTFTYHIPDELAEQLQVGQMVRVAFRTSQESGIVVHITHEAPSFITKPILDILDPRPVLNTDQVKLAQWISEETLTPIGQCLWVMLPPGFTPRSEHLYTLLDSSVEGKTPEERRIISLLKRRGKLNTRQMNAGYGNSQWQKHILKLLVQECIRKEPTLGAPAVKPKVVVIAHLSIEPERIPEIAIQLGREVKNAHVLEILWYQPDRRLPLTDLLETADCKKSVVDGLVKKGFVRLTEDKCAELLLDEAGVYEAIIQLRGGQPYIDILNTLAEAGGSLSASEIYARTQTNPKHLEKLNEDDWITLGESEVWRDTMSGKVLASEPPPILTAGQLAVWERISESIQAQRESRPLPDSGIILLHGVTGSGKTEMYLRAAEVVIQQGKQAIVMVPEIALTTQLLERFAKRFPARVALIHSTLSLGERYDTWRRIRDGQIDVVIGARSALFAPLPKVGLVVLDEEHDNSYKQSPPIVPPFYHARDAAIQYMRMKNGIVILGSATPDVSTYFNAKQGNYVLLHLPDRVRAHQDVTLQSSEEASIEPLPLPPVEVVDMRQELRVGNTSVLSRSLRAALHETLGRGEQALLFLNRRGTASFVFCRDCGYVASCRACELPVTYHRAGDMLLCHHCGKTYPNPTICPKCKSKRIKYFGSGTEQIEKTLATEFSEARVLRWDQDTASNHEAHQKIYEAMRTRQADVLVGTQMITKGLDLSHVTLVGVISADTALGLPDYRANENTFQLLTQVAGRAGRSSLGGTVIFQTYQPQNYAVQTAAEHDYHRFYEREIEYRRQIRWTPFTRLGRILFRHRDELKIEDEARRIAKLLHKRIEAEERTATEVVGPVPCFFRKEAGVYRWHILVRSPNPAALFRDFDVGQHALIDIDPTDIL